MTYEETLTYMFAQLPMYQRVGKKAFKKTLDNIIDFCAYLGDPQDQFKSVHVAGTNGKGSSSFMLSAALQAAGYRIGLYTSPHLKSFTERIRLNGAEIQKKEVVSFVSTHKPFIEELKPSFFELTVAMAFDYFAQKKVDYAVIEVGLGGRLDSTNIISPELSLITNISFDHMGMLGDTLPQIAGEKAGIIKNQTPVVVSEYQEEVAHVFEEHAKKKEAHLTFAAKTLTWNGQHVMKGDEVWIDSLIPHLKGRHQQANVLGVLEAGRQLGLDAATMKQGLEQMPEYIQLKGRWQQLGTAPAMFCDVGHNEAGVEIILEQLANQDYEQLHIVWGMVKDKDQETILKMLPTNARYYFCKPDVPRGMEADLLQAVAETVNLKGGTHASVNEAVQAAVAASNADDLIFIGGSTFVVAELDIL